VNVRRDYLGDDIDMREMVFCRIPDEVRRFFSVPKSIDRVDEVLAHCDHCFIA